MNDALLRASVVCNDVMDRYRLSSMITESGPNEITLCICSVRTQDQESICDAISGVLGCDYVVGLHERHILIKALS